MSRRYNASYFLQSAKDHNVAVKLEHGLLSSKDARTLLRISATTLSSWLDGRHTTYMFEFQESLCPQGESQYFNDPIYFDRTGLPATPHKHLQANSIHDKLFTGRRLFSAPQRNKRGLFCPTLVESHIAAMQCLIEESFEQLKIDMQLSDTRASMLEDCAKYAFDKLRIGSYAAKASVVNSYSPIDIALFQMMNSIPVTPQLKAACEVEYMHTEERMPRFRPKLQSRREYEPDEAPLIYTSFLSGLSMLYRTIKKSLLSKSGEHVNPDRPMVDTGDIATDEANKKPNTLITHCTDIVRSLLKTDSMTDEQVRSLRTGSAIHDQMRACITVFPGQFMN